MAMPTNSLARYSIIVVGNSSADYFYDPNTERLCVTLPYERPKGKSNELTHVEGFSGMNFS